MIGPAYMDYQLNGRVGGPKGNEHPVAAAAPHGVFPVRVTIGGSALPFLGTGMAGPGGDHGQSRLAAGGGFSSLASVFRILMSCTPGCPNGLRVTMISP